MRMTCGLAGFLLAAGLVACGGEEKPQGEIEGDRRPEKVVAAEAAAQKRARERIAARGGVAGKGSDKQILFGDMHVHTTFSIDAFMFSLPLLAGEGVHPPADACDFARYCSALDFFALTDHAEGLTPEHWAASKESIRECNARAGEAGDPDMVAFMGFEWTQVGRTPQTHYGHKNVIFRGVEESQLPARAISALPDEGRGLFAGIELVHGIRWFDPFHWSDYRDFIRLIGEVQDAARCPRGVDSRQLPPDCHENAPVPEVLFEKLHQWGHEVMVIPHGTTWGLYTPPTTSMDKQLNTRQHDADLQKLIEIMSGHGNSEEYRTWKEFELDGAGNKICPQPTVDYLPCCWRAGEIMRERCGDLAADECERRVEEARRLAMDAQISPHLVFPGTRAEDWLDCGQCRNCFKPALGYRPRESVQYTMALSNFDATDADGRPLRFRYGFIASSDNHKARPGTGYKQYGRRAMTESSGVRSSFYDRLIRRRAPVPRGETDRPQKVPNDLPMFVATDFERVASYLYPGGLVAVHAAGRERGAIWDALEQREVYGTSGPRILLWFDLVNAEGGRKPMGSALDFDGVPRFEVRAVGALEQKPGCPESSIDGLSDDRLAHLCRGECYNPGDARHAIEAIEVIRIRPQAESGENVNGLIEDTWRRFECAPNPAGCVVQFEDSDYPASGRDTLYYVRAIQEATPAINGANMRVVYDAEGNAVRSEPCYGDYRTDFDDDCLAPVRERAWSSPIFLDQKGES